MEKATASNAKIGDTIRWEITSGVLKGTHEANIVYVGEDHYAVYTSYGPDIIPFEKATVIKDKRQIQFTDVEIKEMPKDHSQNGESLILEKVLNEIGITDPVCLDIGAGDGYHQSNTRYFKDKGCRVRMVDVDTKGTEGIISEKVNLVNCHRHIIENPNLLSIDIDGNDFWILREMLRCNKPDVICFEVNSQLPIDKCWVMPYKEDHVWDGTWFYGMSYLAGCKLCRDHGYTIYTVVNNTNIIAVRNDHKIKPQLYSFGLTWSHPEDDRKFLEI